KGQPDKKIKQQPEFDNFMIPVKGVDYGSFIINDDRNNLDNDQNQKNDKIWSCPPNDIGTMAVPYDFIKVKPNQKEYNQRKPDQLVVAELVELGKSKVVNQESEQN